MQCITDNEMCSISKSLARLERLLESEGFRGNPYLEFEDLCRCLKVSPASLDEALESEVGLCGAELVDKWRKTE